MCRLRLALVLIATIGVGAACRAGGAPPPCCVDLLAAVPSADIKPVVRAPDAVIVGPVTVAGDTRPGVSVRVPSRITVGASIPARAALTVALALVGPMTDLPPDRGVTFAVGISDGRVYETLTERTVRVADGQTWHAVGVDLGRYGGPQWSLFYRPSAIRWQITLSAYPAGVGAEALRAVWGQPAITGAEP